MGTYGQRKQGRRPPSNGEQPPPGLLRSRTRLRKDLALGIAAGEGQERPAEQQCRKRLAPSSSDYRPTAPPSPRKRPKWELASASPMPRTPDVRYMLAMEPRVKLGVPDLPSAPAVAAMPSGVLVARISNDDTAPPHGVTHQLQTQLEQWEEAVLPAAEGALLRRKWRGMGMVQHKAKQVRETWGAALSQLRREMLDEPRKGC